MTDTRKSDTAPRRIHLVRHGEVHNPDHLVYARLDGFGLSARGRRQAEAAAQWLGGAPVVTVVASPLERAVSTAEMIAGRHGLEVSIDADLTEWRLGDRWAGHSWDALPTDFPGELEAYLEDPADLPFSPESLDTLADRWSTAVRRIAEVSNGDVVFVAHQDPVQAGRRTLTGAGLADFHVDKPGHAGVVTLDPSPRPWVETGHWEPPVDT